MQPDSWGDYHPADPEDDGDPMGAMTVVVYALFSSAALVAALVAVVAHALRAG